MLKRVFNYVRGFLFADGCLVLRRIFCSMGMLFMLITLTACGKWEPPISGTNAATGSAVEEKVTRKKVKLEIDISSRNKIVIPDPAKSHGDVIRIQLRKETEDTEESAEVIQKKYQTDLSFAGFEKDTFVSSYVVGHLTSAESSEPDCLALHVHENPDWRYCDSESEKDYFLILDYGKGTYYKIETEFFLHSFSQWVTLECRDLTGDGQQELVASHVYNKGVQTGVFRCDEQNHKLVSLFSTMNEKEDSPDRSRFKGHPEDDYKVVLEYPDIGYKKTISMIQDGGYKEKQLQTDYVSPYGDANFAGLWKDGKLKKKREIFLYTLYSIDFVSDETGVPQLALMRPIDVGHRSCGIGYMHTYFQYDKDADSLILKKAEYVTYEEEKNWKYTDAAIYDE